MFDIEQVANNSEFDSTEMMETIKMIDYDYGQFLVESIGQKGKSLIQHIKTLFSNMISNISKFFKYIKAKIMGRMEERKRKNIGKARLLFNKYPSVTVTIPTHLFKPKHDISRIVNSLENTGRIISTIGNTDSIDSWMVDIVDDPEIEIIHDILSESIKYTDHGLDEYRIFTHIYGEVKLTKIVSDEIKAIENYTIQLETIGSKFFNINTDIEKALTRVENNLTRMITEEVSVEDAAIANKAVASCTRITNAIMKVSGTLVSIIDRAHTYSSFPVRQLNR